MDDEYERAVTSAELGWLRGVLADLKSGALTWSYEMLAGVAQYLPDIAGARRTARRLTFTRGEPARSLSRADRAPWRLPARRPR